MLPQVGLANLQPAVASLGVLTPLTELGVEGEHHGEVIRLSWGGSSPKTRQKPGHPVAGFAPEHAAGVQVDRGVGVELEGEEVGVLGGVRQLAEPQKVGEGAQLRPRRLHQRAEAAEDLHRGRESSRSRVGSL